VKRLKSPAFSKNSTANEPDCLEEPQFQPDSPAEAVPVQKKYPWDRPGRIPRTERRLVSVGEGLPAFFKWVDVLETDPDPAELTAECPEDRSPGDRIAGRPVPLEPLSEDLLLRMQIEYLEKEYAAGAGTETDMENPDGPYPWAW